MRLVMEASGLAFWPSLSLAVFFAACLGMLAWIYRPGSRALYRELGGLALDTEGSQTETSKIPEK
jgi:cbb3-type cytochrome oxidase subunit 3